MDDTITVSLPKLRTRGMVSVEVRSQPVTVTVDPVKLGAPVATSIAEALRDAIRGITTPASAATLARRRSAAAALDRGEAWAVDRYNVARPGTRAGGYLLNDSGTLAEVTVRPDGDGFAINVPGNRLSTRTLDADGMARITAKLLELVPMLRDLRRIGEVSKVRGVVEATTRAAVTVKR